MKELIQNIQKKAQQVTFQYENGYFGRIYFVKENILRFTISQTKEISDDPTIMSEVEVPDEGDETVATGGSGQKLVTPILLKEVFSLEYPSKLTDNQIKTEKYQVKINPYLAKIEILNQTGKVIFHQEGQPIPQGKEKYLSLRLISQPQEAFFGGGTQNGLVNLKGRKIAIENQNSWTEGGVTSPVPFFFSTKGYGILVNTFTKGFYSFHTPRATYIEHLDPKMDLFILLGDKPEKIIHGYHELTGIPHLSPRYSYYPAHLNAYNRDYWAEVTPESDGAVPFPDGKYYKEYQPIHEKTFNTAYRVGTITYKEKKLVPNVSITKEVTFIDPDELGNPKRMIRESLNGESQNEMFSARGIIKRYEKYDLPLGWFLPNDGYGAGYGQTTSLKGDLENLAAFGAFSREHGVELGLWTQENLTPKDPKNPQKDERDLKAEVAKAGVTALKTDVAWVGEGYTFGLNGVAEAFSNMKNLSNKRPFILSLDGWGGFQRYAAVWSGDQEGSDWQNIQFHIPTYLATGLSGNPNVGGDMDGIFGGNDPIIQTRDIQWKSFTPIQLSMDGWGSKSKDLGIQFGAEFLDINRFYLKLKTVFIPYFYSLGKIAQTSGLPILRPTFFAEANDYTYGASLNHQFLVGDSLLVAPIYEPYQMTATGDDKRASLYLPGKNTTWYDFFTGDAYHGGQTLSEFQAPLWKLPLFVKAGSIIPVTSATNQPKEINYQKQAFYIYPGTDSQFSYYEDDGISNDYLNGESMTQEITQKISNQEIIIEIKAAVGSYPEMEKERTTTLYIFSKQAPKKVFYQGKEWTDFQYGPKILEKYTAEKSSSSFSQEVLSQGNFVTITLPKTSLALKQILKLSY